MESSSATIDTFRVNYLSMNGNLWGFGGWWSKHKISNFIFLFSFDNISLLSQNRVINGWPFVKTHLRFAEDTVFFGVCALKHQLYLY